MDGHPFIKDPAVLQDNYEQVKKRALAVEKRLKVWMTGKVDEVHRHFEHWRVLGVEVHDLQYIQGDLNPADILTRGDVLPEQLQLGSDWQYGPSFMKTERET